jgi:hypothetical protein
MTEYDLYLDKYQKDLALYETLQCIGTKFISLPVTYGTEKHTLDLKIELTVNMRLALKAKIKKDLKRYSKFLGIQLPDTFNDFYIYKNKQTL